MAVRVQVPLRVHQVTDRPEVVRRFFCVRSGSARYRARMAHMSGQGWRTCLGKMAYMSGKDGVHPGRGAAGHNFLLRFDEKMLSSQCIRTNEYKIELWK